MEQQNFEVVSNYTPQGDQPNAIKELVEGVKNGKKHQVLLGATGTGKTFTISNVIKEIGKPTLVFAHNKTLAGQLYSELKDFFPNNAVEYFVGCFSLTATSRFKGLDIHPLFRCLINRFLASCILEIWFFNLYLMSYHCISHMLR